MVRCRHKVFSDDFKEIIIVEKKLPIGIQSFEKTPAHSRDFSRELAGQLLINIFISYMTNPHKYINLTACMERFRILCFPFGFLFL